MKGLLKDRVFRIGNGSPFEFRDRGKWVDIKEKENHLIYGERYKIVGCDEWFEKNCFEEIIK